MAEFPTEVTISGLTYSIERVKNLTHADGEKIDGQCDAAEQTIEIDSSVRGHDRVRLVTIHEIVHAIENHAGMNLKDPSQVDMVARAMYCLIRDNPEFVEWVREPKPPRRPRTVQVNGVTEEQ
jgi:hypothetical protein